MRQRTLILAAAGAIAAAATAVVGLGGQRIDEQVREFIANTIRVPGPAAQPGSPSGAPVAQVTTSQPLRRDIIEWDETTGRFEAVETVEIKARIAGYLQEVLFKDGADVTKGQPLFVIDPRPYERALEAAKAELQQAQTRISNATLDVERGRPLRERQILSDKAFDDRENLVREGQALARVAEAKVKAAELDLSYTRIVAPISGRIGRALITAGNYVAAASGTAGGLATIISQDPIYLTFDVSEGERLKYQRLAESGVESAVRIGAGIQAALPDETGYPHTGQIDFVDNRLDQGSGSLRVRAVVPNDKGLFAAGQFAKVRLRASPRYTAMLLPDEAIGADQGLRFVMVVGSDDIPVRRPVKLGPLVDGLRVVRDGIQAGDWVVTKGLSKVRPGQKVQPKREPVTVSESGDGHAMKSLR